MRVLIKKEEEKYKELSSNKNNSATRERALQVILKVAFCYALFSN